MRVRVFLEHGGFTFDPPITVNLGEEVEMPPTIEHGSEIELRIWQEGDSRVSRLDELTRRVEEDVPPFTREDVERLVTWVRLTEGPTQLYDLADRIEKLLPPEGA